MATRIRAAIATEKGAPFTIARCDLDAPRAGEVRIAVHASGICHTDLTSKDGPFGPRLPAVLGHEGAGVVTDVGPGVAEFAVGDRVVASFGACGACAQCEASAPSYCKHVLTLCGLGTRLDGSSPITWEGAPITGHFFAQSSFATHAVVSTVSLVKLPPAMPLERAAPLACGVQTGAGAVLNVLAAAPDDSLLVLGCGTVGLAAVMAGALAGCRRIVAVDVRASRLELAQALGATHTIDSRATPLARALSGIGRMSAAVDTTAVPEVIEAAFRALGPRGRLVCAGLAAPGTKLSIDANELLLSGRSIRGTIEGDAAPRTFVPSLVEAHLAGRLPVERLITTYPLEAIEDAVADMRAGRVVKPVLIPTHDGET